MSRHKCLYRRDFLPYQQPSPPLPLPQNSLPEPLLICNLVMQGQALSKSRQKVCLGQRQGCPKALRQEKIACGVWSKRRWRGDGQITGSRKTTQSTQRLSQNRFPPWENSMDRKSGQSCFLGPKPKQNKKKQNMTNNWKHATWKTFLEFS